MPSEAQKRATRKWKDANEDSITLRVRKGIKATWKGYAEKAGIPFIEFIRQAVQEKAEREGLV